MLFGSRGSDTTPSNFPAPKKLSIRAFFCGIIRFCTTNGSFRILKKAGGNILLYFSAIFNRGLY